MTLVLGGFSSGLDPMFSDAVKACVGPLPATYQATQGLRMFVQQAALYAQGRAIQSDGSWLIVDQAKVVTYAKPGDSAHNYGLAVDLAVVDSSGTLTWNYTSDLAWPALWEAVRASEHLHSGHDFPSGETDNDHVEWLGWKRLATGASAA